MNKNIKTISTEELESVVAVVEKYVKGLKTGDSECLAGAFHADAVMYGFTEGKLLGGTINNLFDFVSENGSAPEIATRIDILSITPTTAVVRVDMENDAIGVDYTDFHTLIKIDGIWKIVAKVYHAYDS